MDTRPGLAAILRDARKSALLRMRSELFLAPVGRARFALPTLLAILAAAPPAAAQTIEDKVQACVACHGDNGIPPDTSLPVISGQHQVYVYLQLLYFNSGVCKNELMRPIAEKL